MKIEFNCFKEENGKFVYLFELGVPTENGWIDNVSLNMANKNISCCFNRCENGIAIFNTILTLDTNALYKYYIELNINGIKKYVDNSNKIVEKIKDINKLKLSVNFKAPDWIKGKMMYHIFVDRFYRGSSEDIKPFSNRTIHKDWYEDVVLGPNVNKDWNVDFYGGDLIGIVEKLDYIKSLGCSILYLSPIVFSQSNHRYDTGDYEKIDLYAGTMEDLKILCDEAHKKGMRVILDGVFNHTGNDSKYFNEFNNFDELGAYQSNKSKYYDFYRKNIKDGKTYFDYWWGFKNLPVCDGNSNIWQNYIYGVDGVIDKWFSCGIDGLRLDVADELTDEFIEGIRIACKRNKEDSFIYGEVWENAMHMGRTYLSSGKGMDSVMNYQLIDALQRYFKYNDIDKLKRIISEMLNDYPDDTIFSLMNFTSTHDISRIIDVLSLNDKFDQNSKWSWNLKSEDLKSIKDFLLTNEQYLKGKNIYKAYLFFLCFFPGVLSIFYGDEVGLQGLGNLQNRRPFPWDNLDNDLLNYVRYIGSIRNKEDFLETAKLNMIDVNSNYVMFERINNACHALIAVNKTDRDVSFCIPKAYLDYDYIYRVVDSKSSMLKPFDGIALIKK